MFFRAHIHVHPTWVCGMCGAGEAGRWAGAGFRIGLVYGWRSQTIKAARMAFARVPDIMGISLTEAEPEAGILCTSCPSGMYLRVLLL